MIDIKFLRENPDIVKENIKKKFQDEKLSLVDEVIELDKKSREAQSEADDLRAKMNKISKEIGALMGQGKKEEAEAVKKEVAEIKQNIKDLEPVENLKFLVFLQGRNHLEVSLIGLRHDTVGHSVLNLLYLMVVEIVG